MKSLFILLVGMLLGVCGTHTSVVLPAAPSAPTTVQAASHVEGAASLRDMTVALVALVEDEDGDRVRPFCSGVWVSQTDILTARHCVADEKSGEKIAYRVFSDVYPDGPRETESTWARVSRLYAFDEEHDLALLRTDGAPLHGIARTRTAPIVQGMFAQAMGHSIGLWFSYSSGDVAAVRERDFSDGSRLWLQSTTPISPGNSGCGLFDADAALIGIAHGSLSRGQSLNLFVPKQYIDALLVQWGAL